MTYDRDAHLKKRAHVRLDRFEVFHLGDEHNLGALDRWLLVALAMLCDYRSGNYRGTITELAEETGASRRAVGESIHRLAHAELIQVVSDFGPKVKGHLRVLVLDRMIVGAPLVNRDEQRDTSEPHVRPFDRSNSAPIAPQSRRYRALTAPSDANEVPATCDDADVQGSKRRREQGSDVSRDAVTLLKQAFDAEEVA